MAVSIILIAAFVVQSSRQWNLIGAGEQGFLIGDWTISYAGGLVRRGLFGELLRVLAPTAPTMLVVLWTLQTSMYAVMFLVTIRWTFLLPNPRRWIMILLSPGFLLFGLGDFIGTQRKEILALAALFGLAEALRSRKCLGFALPITLLWYSIAVLSHEANSLILIPFLVILRWGWLDGTIKHSVARITGIGFVVASLLGLSLALLAPGTRSQARQICDDLLSRGLSESLCGGSLTYLGQGSGDAVAMMAKELPESLLYLPLAFLVAVPFTLSLWARKNRGLVLAANAPILALYPLGVDWGRWIMIGATLTTVLVIVGSLRERETVDSVPLPLAASYIMTWKIPHYSISFAKMGPSGLLEQTWITFGSRVGGLLRAFLG